MHPSSLLRDGRRALLAAGLLASFTASTAAPDDLVARGKYLATAGDCEACHTAKGGAPYAGGLAMDTPFGPLVTPNITPDRKTGIGAWSDDDFYRTMHEGIGKGGELLYPAMPFPWYTHVSRADVLAIKAYLFSLPPVDKPREDSHLTFPFSVRSSLAGWRQLFFKPATDNDAVAATTPVERGAYLVNGLAHCGECHDGRLLVGASKYDQPLQGGMIDHWYAPNITADVRDGIGGWTNAELVQFLKTGAAPGKGVAAGPMAETVHSLSQLSDADLGAIAAYLKSTPPAAGPKRGTPVDARSTAHGGDVYLSYCSSCHGPDGRGIPGAVPALAGNGAVTAQGPQNVIQVVLGGLPARQGLAPMLAIGAGMSDADVADVANYVRRSWGNDAPATASPQMVQKARPAIDTPMTAGRLHDCPTVAPAEFARAVADPAQGVQAQLAAITDANLAQTVPGVVAKLRHALPNAGSAEIVNGLTSAYCRVVRADNRLGWNAKALQLGHFSELVYTQLNSNGLRVGTR